jgi:hypothetical protein
MAFVKHNVIITTLTHCEKKAKIQSLLALANGMYMTTP